LAESVEVRLALDWELWVVENLLRGATRAELSQALVSQGIAAEVAEEQVALIAASSAVGTMRSRQSVALMGQQALRMKSIVEGPLALDLIRGGKLTREDFYERYWTRNRPVHLPDAASEVPAVKNWSLASFRERFGGAQVAVNTGREAAGRRSLIESEAETCTLGAFIDDITSNSGNDRYIVSRNGLLTRPEFRELQDELSPLPPFLAPVALPRGVSLWVGPKGTYSPPHYDPHNVLFVQIDGRKEVKLAPPSARGIYADMDGYYARGSLADLASRVSGESESKDALSVTLNPGEALFVPVGWFHEVTALDASMMLSFVSFPWENDFHWMRPR
jgi:hypothetical protein